MVQGVPSAASAWMVRSVPSAASAWVARSAPSAPGARWCRTRAGLRALWQCRPRGGCPASRRCPYDGCPASRRCPYDGCPASRRCPYDRPPRRRGRPRAGCGFGSLSYLWRRGAHRRWPAGSDGWPACCRARVRCPGVPPNHLRVTLTSRTGRSWKGLGPRAGRTTASVRTVGAAGEITPPRAGSVGRELRNGAFRSVVRHVHRRPLLEPGTEEGGAVGGSSPRAVAVGGNTSPVPVQHVVAAKVAVVPAPSVARIPTPAIVPTGVSAVPEGGRRVEVPAHVAGRRPSRKAERSQPRAGRAPPAEGSKADGPVSPAIHEGVVPEVVPAVGEPPTVLVAVPVVVVVTVEAEAD